jgi:RecB family endonuclease NucS
MNVADELVFTVSGAEAKPVRATTLPDIGLSERQHLQEWVLAHPEILGPGIRVVTFEFDRWWAAGGDPLDRLDVLGLDRSGRLVVAELKRGRGARHGRDAGDQVRGDGEPVHA